MIEPNEYDAVLGGNTPPPLSDAAVLGNSHPDYTQFRLDMAVAQIPVIHYDGWFSWSGPGVEVNDLQDTLNKTKVECLYQKQGKIWIVYPKAYSEATLAKIRYYLRETNQFPENYAKGRFTKKAHELQFAAFLEMIPQLKLKEHGM